MEFAKQTMPSAQGISLTDERGHCRQPLRLCTNSVSIKILKFYEDTYEDNSAYSFGYEAHDACDIRTVRRSQRKCIAILPVVYMNIHLVTKESDGDFAIGP